MLAAITACGVFGESRPIRAFGNEPFWTVEISPERGIVYARLGEPEVAFPFVAPERSDAGSVRVYGPVEDGTECHRIRMRVLERECRDTMADVVHPLTATVTIDGETLKGCARWADTPRPGEEGGRLPGG